MPTAIHACVTSASGLFLCPSPSALHCACGCTTSRTSHLSSLSSQPQQPPLELDAQNKG